MKEIELKYQEPTEQVQQTQAKKGLRYKRRAELKGGHKVWQINLITGDITEADYQTGAMDVASGIIVRALIEKENCIYIPALNKKNAKRKFDDIVKRATV